MPARRLPAPLAGGASRGRPVRFTFDGREIDGFEGEPLAAALLAAGRSTLSRSFRFHRPRGLMCSTGQCGWCECEVDGVPSVRSCTVPLRPGLVASGEHALPSVGRDVLALLGIGARWIPPTFYHHRFLRPRRLRKAYLEVLRWFGGRGRLHLGDVPRRAGRRRRARDVDVLVVGGGRAGVAVAMAAAEAGADVLVVEARERPVDDMPSGPPPFELAAGAIAVGWYDGVVLVVGPDTLTEVRAAAVVAATGSYDRVPPVPGADRPGVMSARLVRRLIDEHGILPGERAVVVGDPLEAAPAVRALEAGGATVVAAVRTSALRRVEGRSRVEAVVHAVGSRDERLPADLVVLADRVPAIELAMAAGAATHRGSGTPTPEVDDVGRTSTPGLYVAGSAAGRPTRDAAGMASARAAGRAAARAALGHDAGARVGAGGRLDGGTAVGVRGPALSVPDPALSVPDPDGAPPGAVPAGAPVDLPAGMPAGAPVDDPVVIADRAIVCFCEDVHAWEIRAEVDGGYAAAELVKRRTGALTGPCQGKYCLPAFCDVLDACGADEPGTDRLPTGRPPLRPVRLGDLATLPEDP